MSAHLEPNTLIIFAHGLLLGHIFHFGHIVSILPNFLQSSAVNDYLTTKNIARSPRFSSC